MRAVIYPRISKEDQSAYSLEGQIFECKKYIEEKGYTLGEIYVEDGYSAKNMKRPALQRMLVDLANKKFDIIVIWRLDRLTRDTLDGLNMVIVLFRPKGVEFASVTEDIDTSTPDGMMMFTIRLSMAQNEREKIAERSSMGQVTRAKTGKRNTSAKPYGYNVGEGLSLSINEEEAEIVRDIFNMYVSGFGREKIARYLNGIPVPSPRGSIWFELIIGNILKNPVYKGATHYKRKQDAEEKRIVVPNMHEAIISPGMWDLAQTIRARRRDNDMNMSSYEFPFSTIVKCGECGRSYHGKLKSKNHPGTRTSNYRCSGKYRQMSCKASDIADSKLTVLFLDFIKKFKFDNEDASKPLDGVDVVKERKKLEKFIADSRTRRMNYTRAMADNKLKYEDFSTLSEEEDSKTAKWQQELDQFIQHIPSSQKTRKDILATMNNIHKDWDVMTVNERKINIQRMFHFLVIRKREGVWKIVAYKLWE